MRKYSTQLQPQAQILQAKKKISGTVLNRRQTSSQSNIESTVWSWPWYWHKRDPMVFLHGIPWLWWSHEDTGLFECIFLAWLRPSLSLLTPTLGDRQVNQYIELYPLYGHLNQTISKLQTKVALASQLIGWLLFIYSFFTLWSSTHCFVRAILEAGGLNRGFILEGTQYSIGPPCWIKLKNSVLNIGRDSSIPNIALAGRKVGMAISADDWLYSVRRTLLASLFLFIYLKISNKYERE